VINIRKTNPPEIIVIAYHCEQRDKDISLLFVNHQFPLVTLKKEIHHLTNIKYIQFPVIETILFIKITTTTTIFNRFFLSRVTIHCAAEISESRI